MLERCLRERVHVCRDVLRKLGTGSSSQVHREGRRLRRRLMRTRGKVGCCTIWESCANGENGVPTGDDFKV